APVAGQRQFVAAAQRRAVDGGDDRNGTGLDRGQHLGQFGRGQGLAEFLDVGPHYEGPAGAGDDDAGGLGADLPQGGHQPLAHRRRAGIDRRIVDDYHGGVAPAVQPYGRARGDGGG